jgi:hypothetical protein
MMFDLMNRLAIKRAISPVSIADNTAAVSQILDMQGQMAACLVIGTGSIADADATFTVLLEESDASNMAGATAVADADLIGTEALAGFQFDDDNECRKLGYKGSSRYIRATITPANNASAALLAAVWLTTPQDQPAPNPPA